MLELLIHSSEKQLFKKEISYMLAFASDKKTPHQFKTLYC